MYESHDKLDVSVWKVKKRFMKSLLRQRSGMGNNFVFFFRMQKLRDTQRNNYVPDLKQRKTKKQNAL